MKYFSTRGIDTEGVDSAYAIKKGLADDGGLYMPEEIPMISYEEIKELLSLDYKHRAAKILSRFLTDYTIDELLTDASEAYSKKKFGKNPAPVTKLDDKNYMLELWHGPTSAFKDMALQLMPRLFVRAVKKCGGDGLAMILVATSGDTGKAALEGYCDVPGTKVKVFYPVDGVSRVQKLQMQTQVGKNVSVSGILGNFDDAQSGVKKIFSDKNFADILESRGVFLSSANSINWGRLVPQIVYYVSAYCDMVNEGEIELGEVIDVTVPTGNFGNIFAAYIAKRMGMPFGKLICASNKNQVLTDFINTGIYDKNRAFYTTTSPSMDILISSNLERLLYLLLGIDKCRAYMRELSEKGSYRVTDDDLKLIQESFESYSTDEEKTAQVLKYLYENKNCLTDTHTSVAFGAAFEYMSANKTDRKMLTVSTASPYKFASSVYTALTGNSPSGELEALDELSGLTGVPIPAPLCNLDKKTIIHSEVISKDEMVSATLAFAES